MIARFHYDEETYEKFLHDRLGSDGDKITSHIESCNQCQSYIEDMVEDSLSWAEVADVLGRRRAGVEDSHAVNVAKRFLATSDEPNSIGRFARYEVMEILGRGGMGIVMRALDTSLGRQCAVKVLSPGLASSAAARSRFSREAKSAAAVVHLHVVPIQTVDEHEGLPYLVMPVVEGQSLQQRVESDGPLSVVEAVRIAAQVAAGLAAAHDQGLVHRDIKPANVLLENGVERVQITDFGLARAVDDASMTRSGVIAGTPQYMSPEQAHGDSIDHRSDLFSLGSLIYFTLSGHSPFRSETTMGVLNRIINDNPRSIRATNADVPEWLDRIVCKLLSKSPEDRFATASEVNEVLQGWYAHLQQPETIAAPQLETQRDHAAPKDKNRNWIPPWGWLTLAVGVLFFGGYAGTTIFLQTGSGTLRIESNSDADVEIAIRREDSFVKQATVSNKGESFELRSGRYSIELVGKDSSLSIDGDTYELQRGGEWIARIQQLEGGVDDEETPDQPFKLPVFSNLPADTEVHAVGCYWPNIYIGKPDSMEFAPVKVKVTSTGKPMVIVLTSYFSAEWVLDVDADADLRGVIFAGYFDQKVSCKHQQEIPTAKVTYFPRRKNGAGQEWNAENFFFVYSPIDREYFPKMERVVKEIAGRSITTFQSVYRGVEFTIDGRKGEQELWIARRWQSFANSNNEADPAFKLIESNLEMLANDRSGPHSLMSLTHEMDRCKVPKLDPKNYIQREDKPKETSESVDPPGDTKLNADTQHKTDESRNKARDLGEYASQDLRLSASSHQGEITTPAEYREQIKKVRKKARDLESNRKHWEDEAELRRERNDPKSVQAALNMANKFRKRKTEAIADIQFVESQLLGRIALLNQRMESAKDSYKSGLRLIATSRDRLKRGSMSVRDVEQERLRANGLKDTLVDIIQAHEVYQAVADEFSIVAEQSGEQ